YVPLASPVYVLAVALPKSEKPGSSGSRRYAYTNVPGGVRLSAPDHAKLALSTMIVPVGPLVIVVSGGTTSFHSTAPISTSARPLPSPSTTRGCPLMSTLGSLGAALVPAAMTGEPIWRL